MFQLLGIIHGLAIEVRSNGQMMGTSRTKGDPAKLAQKNGWTFCTKKRLMLADRRDILIDVIGIALANIKGYEISDYLREAIGDDGALRAQEIAREILAG